jgi:hypothetical protein
MAGGEHESQEVVANVIVKRGVEIFHRDLAGTDLASPDLLDDTLATEFFVLALNPRIAAEVINGAMLGGGHQPGARIVRDARLRPLLESGDQGILCQVFRDADIAHDPRQAGDESRRLHPPDRVNRAMCIGSRHRYRSHHL